MEELIGWEVAFKMGGLPFNMAFRDEQEAKRFAKEHDGIVWKKLIKK
jgi:hypothetical protein